MLRIITLSIALTIALAAMVAAQAPVNEPTGQKTLAATMNIYAFPAEGQAADVEGLAL